ncbi:MAG: hypothetical protein HYS27_07835 [Deltaproteobacteria bacterium]|nr:hypothetical protein [Deltaproteobacteria bacterium]
MGERRPPTRPGRPSARPGPRGAGRGHDARDPEERTDVVEVPPVSRARGSREGFSRPPDTKEGVHELVSADVSSIEADEAGPAPAEASFEVPPRAAVFIAPPAGLESASFGEMRSTAAEAGGVPGPSTDSMPAAERPIEVKKWRAGGETAAPQRIRTSVVPLPPTDHDATPALLERARDLDTGVDVAELQRALEDVERRLVSLETVLGDRPGSPARAQLSAARRRLAEALALLDRS